MGTKKTETNIKKKYFHGIGVYIASQLGVSQKYARDVLNGDYDDRTTDTVIKIKELAKNFEKAS